MDFWQLKHISQLSQWKCHSFENLYLPLHSWVHSKPKKGNLLSQCSECFFQCTCVCHPKSGKIQLVDVDIAKIAKCHSCWHHLLNFPNWRIEALCLVNYRQFLACSVCFDGGEIGLQFFIEFPPWSFTSWAGCQSDWRHQWNYMSKNVWQGSQYYITCLFCSYHNCKHHHENFW